MPMGTGNLSSEQFHQLPMFAPAHTLKDGGVGRHNPGDLHDVEPESITAAVRSEEPHEMWDRKLEESTDGAGGGLHSLIGREGVQRPVRLSVGLPRDDNPPLNASPNHYTYRAIAQGEIMDGHHRVAAAYDHNPSAEVPITWSPHRFWGESPEL